MDNSYSEIPNQDESILYFNGKPLHEDAHISREILSQLKHAVYVGDPSVWMKYCITHAGKFIELPSDFEETFNLLSSKHSRLNLLRSVLTFYAQTGNPDRSSDRVQYQIAEREMMDHVIDSVKGIFGNPSKILIALALNGAKFFEKQVSEVSGSNNIHEVQAKRVMHSDRSFSMGYGESREYSEEEISNIKTLIIPDDCISTGMTQIALLESLFMKGLKPSKVFMLSTISTTAGIVHLHSEFENLKRKYKLSDISLILQTGALCTSVDENMYLVHQNEEGFSGPMVGDMGLWNRPVES